MLSVNQLVVRLGGREILQGLGFTVNDGETVGVIGPNGSGKTTLFNTLSGFTPVTAGSIDFMGKPITTAAAHRRARLGIGRVFQNFGIFLDMTLRENVITALEGKGRLRDSLLPWGGKNRENYEKAMTYLQEVSLQAKADDKASSLSGGQMRLLEIIRTLAFGAELFLLDEPTAGVSPKMKGEVSALIKKLQDLGKTVMIIEHDINFIEKFCTRIIVLDQGKIVLDDTPQKVRANPMLQEIYFGSK